MKSETFSGTVENAYGEKLPKAVSFKGTYQAYETAAEVKEAKDELNDEEIVSVRNAQRKANARQKAMTEALEAAGISKPDPNSPEQIRKNLIAGFVKGGVSEDIATRQVDALLKQATAVK